MFRAGAMLSQKQTEVVDRARAQGKNISHLTKLSGRTTGYITSNLQQLTVFSHAKAKPV